MTMTDPNNTRVIVADDHPLVLEGIAAIIRKTEDLELVGCATDGHEACGAICQQRPSVAVVGLRMPGLDGFAVAERVARHCPEARLIALSSDEDPFSLRRALSAGFRGYVIKRSAGESLIFAIRSVAAGGLHIDPFVACGMVDGRTPMTRRAQGIQVKRSDIDLTGREEEVLRLFALGYTIKEAAAQLGVTVKSIETYKLRATEKLHLGSRAKIVQYGMSRGWFSHS